MAPKIQKIVTGLTLCEGPHWDIDTQSLYFVDKTENYRSINRYDCTKKKRYFAVVEPKGAGFLTPVDNHHKHFVVALDDQLDIIEWDGISNKTQQIQHLAKVPYQFNDGKTDPFGRLWGGTQNVDPNDFNRTPPDGTLYCLESCDLMPKLENIRIANGLAWNLQINKFYYIDSLTYGIDWFDYDQETGDISNGEQLFSIKDYDIPGIPDGMTIDSDGNLWVAIFQGNRILKIDGQQPGVLLDVIDLSNVTSLCFGGQHLDELYVTCGSTETKNEGGVYKITNLDVKGLPMYKFIL